MEETFKKRGGIRAGSGRHKEEATVRIRLKESVYQRWQQARVLGKFTDSSLADHLLNIATLCPGLPAAGEETQDEK